MKHRENTLQPFICQKKGSKMKKYELDKGFDFEGFYPDVVFELVSRGDEFFQETITWNEITICKIDKWDRMEYEEKFHETIQAAAKKIILQYSTDGTLQSGLSVLTEKSKIKDGAKYVGWILIERLRNISPGQ